MVVSAVRAYLGFGSRAAGRVAVVRRPKNTPPPRPYAPPPATAEAAAAFLDSQEITTTDCRQCGTQIAGVNGRYACACGWVNHWSEGHTELPATETD